MISKKDFILIGIVSMLLSVTGFFLDLNELVPDIRTNIFEILMMASLIYCAISIFYFPIKLLTNKLSKQKS
jgi:hypothetical protein